MIASAEMPEIAGTKSDSRQPLITYALRFYNCERFVKPALESALAQTYHPLEIIVAEDCSTDQTYQLAERMIREYRGPHLVNLFRNERTLGVGRQMMEIHRRMRGEILVIADGDDISLPSRCIRVWETLRDGGPTLMGVDCHFDLIDECGERINRVTVEGAGAWSDAGTLTAAQIARGRAGPHGAVSAYRRIVLDAGTALDVLHSEDLILALRAILLGRLATIKDVLVLRRVHANNISGAVAPTWTGHQLRAWFASNIKRRIAVAATMSRDIARLRGEGRIGPETEQRLLADVGAYRREAKLLRVAPRLGLPGGWSVYRALRRLGIGGTESMRALMSLLAPSLAMVILRRNPLVKSRS